MAYLGNTTTPTAGWDWPGGGYAFASLFTTPSGGGILISDIFAFFATPSGASTGYVCVWQHGGPLITSALYGALPAGSQSAGGQQWIGVHLGSTVYVGGNQDIWIGGYGTGNVVFSSGVGGSSYVKNMGSGGPGNLSGGGPSGIGIAGAYVAYTLLQAPTISSATPNIGIAGTSVAVVGTSFLQADSVTIGGAGASFTVNSDTSITATVPSGAAPGPGSLTVHNPAGTGSIAFTSGGIARVRRSGAWVIEPVSVRRSGSWVPIVVYVRRSGAWVAAS